MKTIAAQLKGPASKAKRLALPGALWLTATFLPDAAQAAVDGETAFILNTFSFLVHGFLVFWMAAGFAMLEAGMVRAKNATTILLKNVSLFSIAAIAYYVAGFGLMYGDGSDLVEMLLDGDDGDDRALAGDFSAGHAAASNWFFQMVFVATAASIVSGTLAERIKLWPFLTFVAILTTAIYPIQGAWSWGGGWLSELGFVDFAGSTVVHAVGGWAALVGALILGPRRGKYVNGGGIRFMPGSSLPLAALGTFILWLGWLGFNGGSQLSMDSAADAIAIANIYCNSIMASAGGVLASLILCQLKHRRIDVTLVLNGALAGLVSITASPDTPTVAAAVLIGAVGGTLVVFLVPLLDRLRIDDVVGAIPVHLAAGIWGTLAVIFTHPEATILGQLAGIAATGVFVVTCSTAAWMLIKFTMGLRPSQEAETIGLDESELATRAWPEFRRAI